MTSISRPGTTPKRQRGEAVEAADGGLDGKDGPISADKAELEALRAEVAAWRAKYGKGELRDIAFTNSAKEVDPLYTALDVAPTTAEDLGVPGQYPFTRGIHPTGYRGKLWTMRQFAGFGSPKETNERYKYLLAQGTTGLSVAFDFPTLMGYDSDHPRSEGEVGKCGVAISSLKDMEDLFDGIPLDKVSTSMTINGPAIILWAFYIAAAEKKGVKSEVLQGTIQNDILKEYMAQHAWCFPIEPALRLIVDCFEWGARHAPKWNTISISGYHIREAGATAAQELAFTLADGFTYVERGKARGLDVDEFAPRLSFFWDIHNDFFEEIAKLRAARRIWARHMKERYGAKNPRSWVMRFHSQTAGVTLTAQQPMNNVVRVAYQAMAAALGGTQSLHTNSMDETLALPTEHAVQVALRTQQILAYETGVPNVIDPLGGSYYVEALTDQLEKEAESLFEQIDGVGGVVKGLEEGWLQKKINESAARQQWEIEQHRRVIVGVNEFVTEEAELTIPLLKIGETVEKDQAQRLKQLRAERDQKACDTALENLRQAARGNQNTMPFILECARKYCTLYEIRRALEDVFGAYREPVFF
jgi:methylmalonyl-CoA mutase N-terminal domain/subunit